MKTIVITIDDESAAKKGYPVSLYLDDGTANWSDKKRALARAVIPVDLAVDNPPADPADNLPLDPKNLRKILLEETNASTRFEPVGEYLYKLLFRDKVKTRWDQLVVDYPGETTPSEGRRILLDIEPKKLRLLPWELMTDGNLPLFLDPLNPMTRGRLKFDTKAISCQWPLHFLVVVGSDDNDPAVQAEEEINSIEEALLKYETPIELEILLRPTQQQLVNKLKEYRPHIFHFIGHGRKGAGVAEPVLAFEASASGPAWEWNEKMIALDLRETKPRFAFINACRTSTEEAATHSWGITEAFIKAGVPAVIGMQADVLGAAAAKFPGEIYEALSSDSSPDVALARARGTVYRLPDGSQRRDWALPTFHISVDPNKVVDMQPPATTKLRNQINTQFDKIKDFVDRVEPRRTLWRAVELPATEAKKLLIISGVSDSGKTWLVYWCLKSCKWRDLEIDYVSLNWKKKPTDGAKNFLDVLRLIIAGNDNNDISGPLRPEAFYTFNALVNHLLDPAEPNPATIPDGQKVVDKGLPFTDNLLDDDSIKAIISAFKTGLKGAANGKTLVLALDDVSKTNVRTDHCKNYLVPELFRAIARGDETVKDIKLILSVSGEDPDDELGLAELNKLAIPVTLSWLDKKEMLMFIRYLAIVKRIPLSKRNVVDQAGELAKGPTFSPSELEKIVANLAGFLGQ